MNILVTGAAGFIGSHVTEELLKRGDSVIAVDDFNDYYDVSLKEYRVKPFLEQDNFKLYREDIRDLKKLKEIFTENKIDKIIHLAARAGVRASIKYPVLYEEVNVKGTLNLLELAKEFKVKNFVFASSSSVYGGNKKIPFSEKDPVDNPISVYAATKKAGELLCYSYHYLFGLKCTCLRFFTVYGPKGRPDMSLYLFTNWLANDEPLQVYGDGTQKRDFTYIDDIKSGIISALDKDLDYEIFNLGNNKTVELNYFISLIEKELGKKAKRDNLLPQQGDVPITYADIDKAKKMLNYNPETNVEEGVKKFVEWYKEFYRL